MLSPYRVLDLSDESGLLCGQILADLGADVVQIEPPAGSPARRVGPWRDGTHGVERSLFWDAYARGKRSVALDLERDEDRDRFESLVVSSDFLIESAPPGRMAALGFDHARLLDLQPGLVHVSITPFGSTGPKAGWLGTDLTQLAASGFLHLSGDGDRAPLRIAVPQAHAHAGADAAIGALIAHFERKRSGRGQHVDVSIQQSLTLANMFRSLDAAVEMPPAERIAGALQAGGVVVPIRHRTRDGWVTIGPSILPSTGHFMSRLLRWVAEEGFAPREWAGRDWGRFGLALGARKVPEDAYDEIAAALDAFFLTQDAASIMRKAVSRRLLIAPVLGLDDLVESDQLRARDYVVAVSREGEGETRHPGPFARFGASPIRYQRAAPRLDEHADALRTEPARGAVRCGDRARRAPLEGIRILDLCWVIAGPSATRMLADYGAEVIRVESPRHPDTLRVSPPWQYGQPHPEGAAGFQSANANKLGLALDWSKPAGREVILDLVARADVVTESFAPGAMARAGLDWKTLSAHRQDLIMLSSCIMGQTGPWRDFAGFGRLAVSFAGFGRLASWPDRPPAGPFGAYTDAVAARYNALAVLAALEHRERTGQGQYIDLSQTEASLHFLAPAFLDWTVNGHATPACGNQDDTLQPHGVYPAMGEDRWIAIAVRSDTEYAALCAVIGRSDLLARRGDTDRVDAAIGAWTAGHEADASAAELQAAGVPAHAVLDTPALFEDAQLRHRDHWIEILHDIYPSTTIESSRLRLSRSPARRPERALSLGRDNRHVLEGLLGYSSERIEALAREGVLG